MNAGAYPLPQAWQNNVLTRLASETNKLSNHEKLQCTVNCPSIKLNNIDKPGLALPLFTATGSEDTNKRVSLPQFNASCSLKNSTGSSAVGDPDSP